MIACTASFKDDLLFLSERPTLTSRKSETLARIDTKLRTVNYVSINTRYANQIDQVRSARTIGEKFLFSSDFILSATTRSNGFADFHDQNVTQRVTQTVTFLVRSGSYQNHIFGSLIQKTRFLHPNTDDSFRAKLFVLNTFLTPTAKQEVSTDN